MTETDWLASEEPQPMLGWLTDCGKLSDRKAQLFAVACCRRIGHLLVDPRSREAVEAAERYAEGDIGRERFMAVWVDAWAAVQEAQEAAVQVNKTAEAAPWDLAHAAEAGGNALAGQPLTAVAAAWNAVLIAGGEEGLAGEERRRQASLLRDLRGPLPFRPVAIDASWRTATVATLATAMYEERRWDEMPILGDALLEAGCTDAELLGHCREKVHARGCWAVDLLLRKE